MDYNQVNYEEKYLIEPDKKPQTQLEEPVSVKEWIITYLLMMIPVANIILMFIYAFSKDEKKSKSNYFKAQLIMTAIMTGISFIFVILWILFMIFIGGMMLSSL